MPGSPIRHKPDLVLLDITDPIKSAADAINEHDKSDGSNRSNEGNESYRTDESNEGDSKPQWKNVHSLSEITIQSNYHTRLQYTIQNKVYIRMNKQHDWHFIIFLSFYGSTTFKLSLCDCAGLIHSEGHDIHKDPLILLCILVDLMMGSKVVLGYNPSICQGPDNEIVAIMVDGVEYDVIGRIFSSTSLRDHATRYWHVKKDGKEYVIKDSWIHEGRTSSKIDILKVVSGLACVPIFIAEEHLKQPSPTTPASIDSTGSQPVNSTHHQRVGLNYPEARIH